MQCETFELQVHAMLDERREADADTALTEHASECPTCQQLLADYTTLLGAVSSRAVSSGAEAAVPTDLADRVLADLPPSRMLRSPQTSRVRRVLGSKFRLASALAVAASLLIAAYLGIDYYQRMIVYGGIDPSTAEAEVRRLGAILPLLGVLDQQDVESVCRATGRSMATLPTAVWLITSDEPPGHLLATHAGLTRSVASGIRPLAISMMSAFDALRSTLPSKSDSPIDTDPASTDTSRIDDRPGTAWSTITA